MKKIIILFIAIAAFINRVEAQQIKRATLSSAGSTKVAAPFRISYTAGSCPGCNTLTKAGTGSIRQGFQQPPNTENNPSGCPPLTAVFNIVPIVSPLCGTKYDFEFNGATVAGATYEWDFGDGAYPRRSTQLNPMGIAYATAGAKIIGLTVRKGGCSDTKAKVLNISSVQMGFAINPSSIVDVKCRGSLTGGIKLAITGGVGTKTFRWSNGATTQDLANVAAGRYTVTATDGNGCLSSVDTVVNQPAAALSFRDSIKKEECIGYNDGTITLTVSGGTRPYKFLWDNGATSASIGGLSARKYNVTISDSNNCKIDTALTVTLRCDIRDSTKRTGFVYNVITPNSDGKNDKWIVTNIDNYPNNELIIYNRWGQPVYTVKPYRNNWDGTTDEGKDLPSAAYYYLIKLNDDKQQIWAGSITVIR